MAAPHESEPLLLLERARLGYGRRAVLDEVEFAVHRGDFVAVVGPNGAGKTTLLRTLLGILPPLAGRCELRARVGYSPQRGALDPIYPFTTAEVVAMGLLAERRARADDRRVASALAACGVAERADALFRDLSGGQKQRALLARALVADPELLVLDEPTNDLDLRGQHEVMELVRALHERGRTVLLVAHDLGLVARYAARVAFAQGGRLVVGPAEEQLAPERLAALYGLPIEVGELGGRRVIAPAAEERA